MTDRQQQDLNLRGYYPFDFESNALDHSAMLPQICIQLASEASIVAEGGVVIYAYIIKKYMN